MEIQTVSFVKCSELFKDCPLALEVLEECSTASWGGNAYTLVWTAHIQYILKGDYSEEPPCKLQIDEVLRRTASLGDVLIDLEN